MSTTETSLRWMSMGAVAAIVRRGDRKLVVAVVRSPTADLCQAMAFETTADGKDVEAVLADHDHEVLGAQCSFATAKRRCAAFARKWLKSTPSAERCPCATISSKVAA